MPAMNGCEPETRQQYIQFAYAAPLTTNSKALSSQDLLILGVGGTSSKDPGAACWPCQKWTINAELRTPGHHEQARKESHDVLSQIRL